MPATVQRQTQALLDATSDGSSAVWDRYLDPQAVYTDESSVVSTKAQLVAQNNRATVLGGVAVATYVADEHEAFSGHPLHCLRTDPPSVKLAERQMAECVGRYNLGPAKVYEIRMQDGHLEGQEAWDLVWKRLP